MKHNLKTFREAVEETNHPPSVKAWIFLRLLEIENELHFMQKAWKIHFGVSETFIPVREILGEEK